MKKDLTDVKELDGSLAALNRSAERLQTLWFTFLGITLYFAISVLTVTHQQLVLTTPQTLPALQIQVPLVSFFIIAPAFFLIIHVYLLMMLVLLARTANGYEEQLIKTIPRFAKREEYRLRTENSIFLQLLSGMEYERSGRNGRIMSMIALFTLAIAPVTVLVIFQLVFLPYHHFAVTWWHRSLILLDIICIIVMWSAYRRGDGIIRNPITFSREIFRRLPSYILSLFVIYISFIHARWAGEPSLSNCNWTKISLSPTGAGELCEYYPDLAELRATEGGLIFGLFPDRIKLSSSTIVGQKLFEEKTEEGYTGDSDRFVPTRIFDGRNFVAAQFDNSDLRRISFKNVRAFGINLRNSQLQGSQFETADFRAANLAGAQLQGSNFYRVRLQGSSLNFAQLQGASIVETQLTAASLGGAQLQGVWIKGSTFDGVWLADAQLQGSWIVVSSLRGAVLVGANFRAAQLLESDIQGASLRNTDFKGAYLNKVNVFGTLRPSGTENFDEAIVKTTFNQNYNEWGMKGILTRDFVLNEKRRVLSSAKLTTANPSRFGLFDRLIQYIGDQDMQIDDYVYWHSLSEKSKRFNNHDSFVIEEIKKIACAGPDAPYIARSPAISENSIFIKFLIEDHAGPKSCIGSNSFSRYKWRRILFLDSWNTKR